MYMYVAIEGIKGSGKSTVIEAALQQINKHNIPLDVFAITNPMCPGHPLERMLHTNNALKLNDDFIEKLFHERALWNQAVLNQHCKHVLGDRSIATAIVTRWNKWNDPYQTIKKVNHDYASIMKPDVIVWLNTEPVKAAGNICKRTKKAIGEKEETPAMLDMACDVYKELFSERVFEKKVGKVQIIEIRECSNIKDVSNEISSIIKFYTKS